MIAKAGEAPDWEVYTFRRRDRKQTREKNKSFQILKSDMNKMKLAAVREYECRENMKFSDDGKLF